MRFIQLVLVILICVTGLKADDDKQVIEIDGKKYTIHQVNKKETLFSIAKFYNIELQALIAVNRLTLEEPIGKNHLLIIPLDAQKMDLGVKVTTINNAEYQLHLVQPGETIYSIAKSYNLDSKLVMEFNGMKTPELKYGTEIFIPIDEKNNLPKQSEANIEVISAVDSDSLTLNVKDTISQADLVNEQVNSLKTTFEQADSNTVIEWKRGVATWVDDGTKNSVNFYALYSDAPIGSILQIKNMLNFKTVYVKVVGEMPSNNKADNSIIKLSAAVIDYLGIYDERFLVEIHAHK